MAHLRIGSRGSQLALWQANHISALLRGQGHTVAITIIKTTGDKILDVPLAQVGTKGMFTKEIEEVLAADEVDLAVHSLKDLPTELPAGFAIAAITERQDPRDAFVSQKYESVASLPQGACVGTSSLRRQAQLKAVRPDLDILPLRGNVDTRLRKMLDGDYDAVILAAAGLERLGLTEHIRERIDTSMMCPAAGQGALAVEIRQGDDALLQHLHFLDDKDSRDAVTCERTLLSRLGGGCQVPIGAFAERRPEDSGALRLVAIVAHPDGSILLRETALGDDPAELGNRVGEALLKAGAAAILRDVYAKGFAHVTT